MTGAAANKAKAAALAAYPGGTVNRVVLLSNGEYNVHIIAMNWPHHVFVSNNFRVVGAEKARPSCSRRGRESRLKQPTMQRSIRLRTSRFGIQSSGWGQFQQRSLTSPNRAHR